MDGRNIKHSISLSLFSPSVVMLILLYPTDSWTSTT